LAALLVEWLTSRGMAEDKAAEVLSSDYAGQANKLHIKKKTSTSEKSAKHAAKIDALPQRQARHLAR